MADENEQGEEKSKGVFGISKKVLAGAGSGVIGFTTVVFAYIDSKVSDIDKRIEDKYISSREYVDARHSAVNERLIKIENLLIKIDDRIYEISRTKKGD